PFHLLFSLALPFDRLTFCASHSPSIFFVPLHRGLRPSEARGPVDERPDVTRKDGSGFVGPPPAAGCPHLFADNLNGFLVAVASSVFIVKKQGLRRTGASGSRAVAHEERDSEQDEREVRYSPRAEESPSRVPTEKKSHKERRTMAETHLGVEASLKPTSMLKRA
ncbi:hypothetical protein BHM03_00062611, partial [Ensete ventricosum]